MKPVLNVLIVEDSEFDAQIMANLIRKGGQNVVSRRVDTAETFRAALQEQAWDVILADYNLPVFSAPEALTLLQESGLDIPFLIVSGGIGEATAVAAMKAGAHDYLMKGNLQRLAPAVDRELREAALRAERREAIKALAESERRYRLLYETAGDAIVLMDTTGRILFANPAIHAIFGYTQEEVLGRDFTLLLPEALHSQVHEWGRQFAARRVTEVVPHAIESLGRRRSGEEFPADLSFNELTLEGERRLVCFIRDITERKRAERELLANQEAFRIARNIQQHLFPRSAPKPAGFDIAGVSYPADEAGGDFYDYLAMLKGRLGIVVADVSGHGVGPALLMAETRAYLRSLIEGREDVGDILTRVNHLLAQDVDEDHYVTLFFGRLDPTTRSFVYSSAGHPPAYLLDAQGQQKAVLKRTGGALGFLAQSVYPGDRCLTLEPGDMLLVVTDGVSEASAPDESLFGIERALEVVRAQRERPAGEILEALYRAVRDFSQGTPQTDDLTAILVKVAQA